MKNILISLSLVLASTSWAIPMTPLQDNSSSTKYEQLNQLFQKGSLPNTSDLKGIWTGRCFDQQEPNLAKGMFLAAGGISKDGPLFSDDFKFLLTWYVGGGQVVEAPEAYDNVSEEGLSQVWSFAKNSGFPSRTTIEKEGMLISSLKGRQEKIRIYQNYVMVQVSNLPNSDTATACYFFKKLKSLK